MEPTEIFRTSLRYLLEKNDRSQADIARILKIAPQRLNDYLGQRVNFSEHRRQQIANLFNMTYLEMLNLGYRLATGSDPVEPELPIELKDIIAKLEQLDQDSLKIIDALADKLPKKNHLAG